MFHYVLFQQAILRMCDYQLAKKAYKGIMLEPEVDSKYSHFNPMSQRSNVILQLSV